MPEPTDPPPVIPGADQMPEAVDTSARPEDGPQDGISQEPDLEDEEIDDGDDDLADPAVDEVR